MGALTFKPTSYTARPWSPRPFPNTYTSKTRPEPFTAFWWDDSLFGTNYSYSHWIPNRIRWLNFTFFGLPTIQKKAIFSFTLAGNFFPLSLSNYVSVRFWGVSFRWIQASSFFPSWGIGIAGASFPSFVPQFLFSNCRVIHPHGISPIICFETGY